MKVREADKLEAEDASESSSEGHLKTMRALKLKRMIQASRHLRQRGTLQHAQTEQEEKRISADIDIPQLCDKIATLSSGVSARLQSVGSGIQMDSHIKSGLFSKSLFV
ncbi:hypothetical protein E1301_Tti018276 [Triplophysa tibetana]|uniref:Uncharacterized protein n=1 Tax=Triplophysa tibetana TaxID=1572043 RepID=A0A5A9NM35_9TELE|nr:hypothetical protein E1301_Tti018276 [Triplophysa tibetana]